MVRLAVLAAVLWLCSAGSAYALSGKAIQIGTGTHEPPSVAVDASGTAYVAWYTESPAPAQDVVHYCVLPAGASACRSTGELTIPNGGVFIDAVQVLATGSTVSILASASGFPDEITEWQSTDGGATWPVIDNGLPVANSGPGDDFTVGGVVLPGGSQLGFGWTTVGGPPIFDAFPATAAPSCSSDSMCPFATLQPSSEPDQVSNTGGSIAASSGADPGVLAVYETQETKGTLGCDGGGEGLGFAYGSGVPSATNSYSISPGQVDSAWRAPVARGECNLDAPFGTAAGGGPAGLGIVGNDAVGEETFYQSFDQATRSFGPKFDIINHHSSYPSLSQDGRGNLYTTFDDSSSDKIALAVSTDGGKTWTDPQALTAANIGDSALHSSVNAAGQGWVAWLNGRHVFAQQFDAADAGSSATGTPPTVSGGSTATTTTTTITISVNCTSSCTTTTVTTTVTTTTTTTAAGAQIARVTHPKHSKVVIASGKFTLRHAGTQKLTLHLTRKGRALLSHHPRLTAALTLSARVHGHIVTHTRTLHITPGKSGRHNG